MKAPPVQPQIIVPEILPPERPGDPPPQSDSRPTSRVAFHPLAALTLIVFDNLWNFPEFAAPYLLILTIPFSFLSVLVAVYLIQRRQNGDTRGTAFGKAFLLAVLAAIPTSITGTPVGLALLAWAGIKHPWRS
ncbi:MAG TPA: hypothetical protein PLX89_13220 [Verrucomicrobiota bacterium]|nr:hypothetical protein [Verrucomicrobiales bacterium]HRI13955.1 hypothetical protein [Verrucomicrobiota bacterium]